MPNEPHKLEPILEHILQSQHQNATDTNRILEHATGMKAEGDAKIAEKLGDVAKAISKKKPDEGVRTVKLEGIELVTIKGEKGEDGKDADNEKIIEALTAKVPKKQDIVDEITPVLLEKVPKIEDIVAKVMPNIEHGEDGNDGDDGQDADPKEVAYLLKNDPAFIESTKGGKGDPGERGSPDTGIELVAKLSSLEGENRFSFTFLKDVPEFFKKPSSGGGFLKDMADVSVLTEPTNGQTLVWNTTLKKWTAGTASGGGTPGGSDTQVQFNDGGSFGGDSGMVFNKTTDALTILGIIKSGTSFVLEDPGAGTNTITIQAPTGLGANYTLTLPTDDGNSNQVLTTNGSGVLSWVSPAISIGQTVTSGTDGSVLFVGAGVLAQNNSKLYWDNGNVRLGINSISGTPSFTLDVGGQVRFVNSNTSVVAMRVQGTGDGGFATRGIFEAYNYSSGNRMAALTDDGSGMYGGLHLEGGASGTIIGDFNGIDREYGGSSDKRAGIFWLATGGGSYEWSYYIRDGVSSFTVGAKIGSYGIDCPAYYVGGVAGASGTATALNTLTIVNGIITNIA